MAFMAAVELAELLMGEGGLLAGETVASEATPLISAEARATARADIGAWLRTNPSIEEQIEVIGHPTTEFDEAVSLVKRGGALAVTAGTAGTLMSSKVPKIGGKRKAGSQSGAQPPYKPIKRRKGGPQAPMPPKGVTTSTHWYDRTRKKWVKRKRPLKKRPSMRKKAYKKRTPTRKRRVVKKKTVKRKYMRAQASTKYHTHGIVSRHDVSYFGFQANGGRDEFLGGAADAILRSIAARWKISIPSPDEPWDYGTSNVDRPHVMRISYRRHEHDNEGTSSVLSGADYVLNNSVKKHTEHVNAINADLRGMARNGYMPYFMQLWADSGQSQLLYRDNKFGDFKVMVTSTMKIKLRNITHNDKGSDHDMTSALKNPLEGKAYTFRGDVPEPKEVLKTYTISMAKFLHDDNRRGICFGPQGIHTDVTPGNQDGIDDDDGMEGNPSATIAEPFDTNQYMSTPPTGSSVFENCSKTHNIVMPVAREMVHTLKTAFNGTLSQLMMKYNQDRYRRAPIGGSFWLGLRQKFRNSVTLDPANGGVTTQHDDVTVEYQVETVIRSAGRFVRPETTPAAVNILEMNNISGGLG